MCPADTFVWKNGDAIFILLCFLLQISENSIIMLHCGVELQQLQNHLTLVLFLQSPCKHAFCLACAEKASGKCPRYVWFLLLLLSSNLLQTKLDMWGGVVV